MNITKFTYTAAIASMILASCSNELPKNQEEKYSFIETEVNKATGVFDNEQEASEKRENLVISALEEALQENDFVYASKYCMLLKTINHPISVKYNEKIKAAKTSVLKDSLMKALDENNFSKAREYCNDLNIVEYTVAERCRIIINDAESTYFISQNNDEANERLLSSIAAIPSEKTAIGSETESVHMYDVQAKRHNKQIDEYLDQALKFKNYALAQKLLSQYVDELIYKTATKNGNKINVVASYSSSSKDKAVKRYEEVQKQQ